MAQISSSLVVRLVDDVTGPARIAANSIKGIGQALSSLNGKGVQNFASQIQRAIEVNQQQLSKLRGSLFDTIAMGAGLYAGLNMPTDLARQFESVLLDIGQKADLGDLQIKKLGGSLRTLATSLNLTTLQSAQGVDFLAGMGLDPDRAMILMEPIGKAATAYKAQVEDLAKAGYAALDNLKVKPEEFARALDVMAQSGKEGAFELRDMAQYFPSLTASAQAFGMQGVKGVADLSAALQVARKGAGDSAEAANNLANLLQKLVSPETTRKFRKMGVDVRQALKEAQAQGVSPIEMIVKLTHKTTKGDLATMGDLFEDAQVQKALRPLIQNLEEYQRIREKAGKASGVVDVDFQRRLQTGEAQLKLFNIHLQELGISIGTILLPPLNELLSHINVLSTFLQSVTDAYPTLTRNMIVATSALIAFRVASFGVRYAARLALGGVLEFAFAGARLWAVIKMMALSPLRLAMFGVSHAAGVAAMAVRRFVVIAALSPLTALQASISGLSSAFLSLLNPIRLVTTAISVMRFAVLSTGIGAILMGIALAGAFLYENWEGIGIAFNSFKRAFMRAMEPVQPILAPILTAFTFLGEKISSFLPSLQISKDIWESWGSAAGKAVAEALISLAHFLQDVMELPSKMLAALSSGATQLYEVGVQWIQSLWDGMVVKFNELMEWVKAIPSRIASAIQSIDLSGLMRWPSMPSFLGGGESKREFSPPSIKPTEGTLERPGMMIDGARASGGPVLAGRTYLVGEKGPELFTASSSGRIISHDALSPHGGKREGTGVGEVTLSPTINISLNGSASKADAHEMAEIVYARLNDLTQKAYRNLYADIGMA